MGADWHIIEHHHPNVPFEDPQLKIISKGTNFKARVPSDTDFLNGPMKTGERTGRPAQEGITWRDPSGKTNTVYRTLYGYDPATKKLWVSHANEMGGMSPREYFDDLNAYRKWEAGLDPAGPATQRTPAPAH
jgi:hypothetical protein